MILLSFDIEEFDMPREYGKFLTLEEQVSISTMGTSIVLGILRDADVKATFYCTANYAIQRPGIIRQIVDEGHEIASHGYFHFIFKREHLEHSKTILEDISGTTVCGFRMPRMMPVDEREIEKAGYIYNSLVNTTWLPVRYNNFFKPRSWFYDRQVLQIPVSVTPFIRLPLCWLTFHHLPLWLIKRLCSATFKKDGYLNLYFHPWEFIDLHDRMRFGLPTYISRNSGAIFVNRMTDFINWAQLKGYKFCKTADFVKSKRN